MDTIEESAPIRRRRRHSAEFKAKAVQECMQPGVSIAAIALHHRLNANLLRRWVAEQEAKNGAPGRNHRGVVIDGKPLGCAG